MNTHKNLIGVCTGWLFVVTAFTQPARANLLVDPGFEANPLTTATNVLGNFPAYQGAWGVEAASITGVDGGITPFQAVKMLRMVDDGAGTTQCMQVTDVTSYAAIIDAGGATVNMSAMFNVGPILAAAVGGVHVSFFTASNYGSLTGTISNSLTLDSIASTWQPISVNGPIPVGTRWLLSQVVYNDASLLGPDGRSYPGYVDAADLTIAERQGCQPDPRGHVCLPTVCPIAGDECVPRCVSVVDGIPTAIDCDCRDPNACRVELIMGGPPPCVGNCPTGFRCERSLTLTPDGYVVCCDCVPDVPRECAPTADGQRCEPFLCPVPPPDSQCQPRCIRSNPLTGQTWIIECDCRNTSECHPFWQPGAVPFCEGICPPGKVCVENKIQNPDGTIDLCCDCVTPPCLCPGDVNGDGILSGADIAGFVRCLLGASLPVDHCECADLNGDGSVNYTDLQLFISRLFAEQPCDRPPCPPRDLIINLTTGVDGSGALIPVGQKDDTWNVILDASGGTVPRPATVIAPHPAWLTIPGSQWISANYVGHNGDYFYEFCFCLDKRFSNPVLFLQLRADDAGDVYLNGNFIGVAAGFSNPTPASITVSNPALFVVGQNCVTVVVHNLGGPPTGLNLLGTFRAHNGKCCCDGAKLDVSIGTGVDDTTGGLIPINNNDDTWEVTVDPSGGSVPRPATVITPHPAWLTIPGTQWISAAATGPNGSYTYRHCFCLDPRFENAQLVIDLRADDYARVYLNGNLVGATPTSYAFNTPQPTHVFVTNQALFKAYENCIEVIVVNSHGVVTGLNLDGRITAEKGVCCPDQRGACCFPNGMCEVLSPDGCEVAGGTYSGSGTTCLGDHDLNGYDDACQPPPPYSCCLSDGFCVDLAPGTTHCPEGGVLITGPCGTTQACCRPDGTCFDTTEICCRETGGAAQGPGTSCATFTCRLPQQYSCCDANGQCIDLAPGVTVCPNGGAIYLGPCGNFQACCLPDGTCRDMAVNCCQQKGGTPKGVGSSCTTVNCQPPPPCTPDPLTPRCVQTQCPSANEICQPWCVLVDDASQQVLRVTECDCRPPNECHVDFGGPPPSMVGCTGGCPSNAPFCHQTRIPHGNGTTTVCCECRQTP